jgi:hypothetical protein
MDEARRDHYERKYRKLYWEANECKLAANDESLDTSVRAANMLAWWNIQDELNNILNIIGYAPEI